jgi:glycosyltransferase involved in cell wall biosynthesis
VDTSLFSEANAVLPAPTFIAVGRFVDKKAPQLTLLSFQRVLDECREARLIMVGSGELLEACKQMANALGISSSVKFPGVCSPSEIAGMLRSATAFVQHSIRTSYGDSESLGVVFLEAGASGLPVVATKHDGIPEVVIDGETGFLVREGDIEEMAQCMIKLAKDPALAAQLGKAARERICTKFSMEKSINNLWRIIANVIQ